MLDKVFNKVSKEAKFTFFTSFSVALLVHLYLFTNDYVNKDGVYNYYATQDISQSGRFTLTYLAGVSSYFDLHYLNGLLSTIYIALTVVLLAQLFHLKSKVSIFICALLYAAFPSVAGIFPYMYTADAYFLANLLTVLSIYLIYKLSNKYVSIPIASFLIYVAIGTYQANLGYVITLVIFLFIKDLFIRNHVLIKQYISYALATFFGLLAYVIHFKLYEQFVGSFTEYQGINNSGQISLYSIVNACEQSIKETLTFLFNKFQFINPFEKLNALFVILFLILMIAFICWRKVKTLHIGLIIFSFMLLPFAFHLIYFISPEVNYHLLMKQQIVFMFIIPLVLIEQLQEVKLKWMKSSAIATSLVLIIIGFNFVIITNIYYEKFDDVNKQTSALMTQIAYDIRKVDNYSPDHSIVFIGKPTSHLSLNEQYDKKTPINVGVSKTIVYDTNTLIYYLRNEIGLSNGIKKYMKDFVTANQEQINQMEIWPSKNSLLLIEDTIVIKFSEEL